jgi:predicted  nucleic acid-binding Zn-ribbon protein
LQEKMRFLIGLQDCDLRISHIRKRITEAPLRIQSLEEGLNRLETRLEEESKQFEEAKHERREVEKEIEVMDSRVEKSQVKLSNIKSNKEYKAALKEIDDLKREKSVLEDRAIELMEALEQLERGSSTGKAELEETRRSVEVNREEILRELKRMEGELVDLEKERVKFCQSLDRDLLERYDFLRERKGGLAISSVINAVCQACHMGIPPQKFNELIRGDALLDCPHCNRIIYWGDNEGFQKAQGRG